jgi:hypothetical protein
MPQSLLNCATPSVAVQSRFQPYQNTLVKPIPCRILSLGQARSGFTKGDKAIVA